MSRLFSRTAGIHMVCCSLVIWDSLWVGELGHFHYLNADILTLWLLGWGQHCHRLLCILCGVICGGPVVSKDLGRMNGTPKTMEPQTNFTKVSEQVRVRPKTRPTPLVHLLSCSRHLLASVLVASGWVTVPATALGISCFPSLLCFLSVCSSLQQFYPSSPIRVRSASRAC